MRYQRKFVGLLFTCIFTVPAATSIQAAQTTAYSYDALGRVATVCFVESGRLITYSYDGAGNRTAIATTGTSCGGGTAPPPNQPPVAVNDFTAGPYYKFDTVQVAVLSNDSDPDGDPLTITGAGCITSGCFVVIDGDYLKATGTTTGDKIINYTISDGRGGTAAASAYVTFQLKPGCGEFEICP